MEPWKLKFSLKLRTVSQKFETTEQAEEQILAESVDKANLIVQDSLGNVVEVQYVHMDNATINLRNLYTKAYLGISSAKVPKFWLAFGVSLPPLGWNTYFISEETRKEGLKRSNVSVMEQIRNQIVDVGPGNLKMSFSASGQLLRMCNSETGGEFIIPLTFAKVKLIITLVDVSLQQRFLWYDSSFGEGDGQASGAYIFRPSGHPSVKPMVVVRGALVDEIHQQFDSWIYQIGPIPVIYSGKEVITQMKTNLLTNKQFYTDSNGRDFMKRIRNYREDWNLSNHQPVAGNYYPINLGIYVNDSSYEFSVLVDRATGGASIKNGEIELMLHRLGILLFPL
ncbi:Alpha-mannosidase [Bienertia sinuspersici]